MENQVGEDQVVGRRGVGIVLQGAHLVPDDRVGVLFPGGGDHLLALVDSQNLGGSLLDGILAVPAIAAPQVQDGFPRQRGKEGEELVPFAGPGQAFPAAGHLGVFLEETVVVVEGVHGGAPL